MKTRRGIALAAVLLLTALAPAAAAQEQASAAFDVAPRAGSDGGVVQRQPDVAYGAGVYLAVWSSGSRDADRPACEIRCGRIDAKTLKPLDEEGLVVCPPGDLREWPAVAFDGSNFLVVWQDFRSHKHYDIYAARVSPEGKVLDAGGFAVAAQACNQARPKVAFAGGNFVVAWVDARVYPVYGIYATRVSPEGKVLDGEGFVVDAEDPRAIAKVRPPGQTWMGEHDYWWQHLASRYEPVVASRGEQCLVAFVREKPFAQKDRPVPVATVVNGATGKIDIPPVLLSSGEHDVPAVCPTRDGWCVVLIDHGHGWSPAARLAAIRLDARLTTRDAFARPGKSEPNRLPLEDFGKTLIPKECGSTNPGKGSVAFWRPAAAWDGKQVVTAFDFGWRDRRDANAITYVIAFNRVGPDQPAFASSASSIVASTARADQAVANPALAAGPDGQVLLVYEHDRGVDRQTIRAMAVGEK